MSTVLGLFLFSVIFNTRCFVVCSPEEQTAAFSKDEMYQDIFLLCRTNFSSKLLASPDSWIVVFHTGMIDKSWKSMAVSLRGVVWVGMIDTTVETKLLRAMKYDINESEARVYPYGNRALKTENWKSVSNPNEARRLAINSLPDSTLKLQGQDINDFITESIMSKPSRFPAIIITEDDEVSPVFKALALRFNKYFHFGRMVRPHTRDLKQIGLDKLFLDMPALLIMVTKSDGKTTKPQLNAITYNKKSMGEMTYPNIIAFLFLVNREFRHELPFENLSNDKSAVEMEDILKIENQRFDINAQKINRSPEHMTLTSEVANNDNVATRISDEL